MQRLDRLTRHHFVKEHNHWFLDLREKPQKDRYDQYIQFVLFRTRVWCRYCNLLG